MMKKQAWALASLVLLIGCAENTEHSLPVGAHYVNMGSSFASGPGLGPAQEGGAPRCGRTVNNYAYVLAERLQLSLQDVSCSGARSEHMIGPWNELPAQVEAVKEDTKLVTITVGGNDLNYVGNLIAASCEEDETLNLQDRSFPCPPIRAADESDYITLENNLRDLAQQLTERAPTADIIFVQYVALVPEAQCTDSRLTEDEAADFRVTAARLADITAKVAREFEATALNTDEISARHTPCEKDPWSIGFPKNYDGAEGVAWHPNVHGMEMIADRLEDALVKR